MQKRDIKVGAIGAVLGAIVLVAGYQGKIKLGHASSSAELGAGESAQIGPDGIRRGANANAAGGDSRDGSNGDPGSENDPANAANKNLVSQVGEYRARLQAVSAEKSELETKLKKSEAQLAASQDGSAATAMKHDFDLSGDDWKELAKDGTIKFQMPCIDVKSDGWSPSPEKLNALGLAPQDAAPIKNAYQHSSQRVWAQIKPLCAAAVGSPEIAERIGPDTCIHLVLDVESEKDNEATKTARRQVGEIRAGVRPMPGPNEVVNPVLKLFLAATGAAKDFETELAQSFGPEEAHRIVYADELCMGSSIFGGRPKGAKAPKAK